MKEIDPWKIIEKLRGQHKEEIHNQWMPLVAEYRSQLESLQSRSESLEQEMQEQARIIGMGAERELRMATKMEKLDKDAVRYAFVKTLPKEMLLAWRGMYGCSDEAIDAAMQANKGE